MSVKTYKKGINKKLTKNLNLCEIHCHGNGCCNKTLFDTELAKLFQKMRNVVGPLTVESGYRCNWHNRQVGGANGSGHCKGMALDIVSETKSSEQIAVCAELKGVTRIGIYDSKKHMAHIGTGIKCHWHNTGNYLSTSHSFIGGEWATPKLSVSPKSNKKYIRCMQAYLFVRGYKGKNKKALKLDGEWGSNTQFAVDKFRTDNGWKKQEFLKAKAIAKLCK